MPILKPISFVEDLDLRPRPCEAQGCSVTPVQRDAFSFIICYQHVHAEQGYASYQCPSEQHWACCHDHAMQAASWCIDEHHDVSLLVPKPDVQMRVPQTTCAICDAPLTSEAYAIPICYAVPGLGYAGYTCGFEIVERPSLDPNDPTPRKVYKNRIAENHWCCSEEHAKAAAHACMHEHLHEGPHG